MEVAAGEVPHVVAMAGLAAELGVDATLFLNAFNSDAARTKTLAHFRQARQAGVSSFPTLIMQQDTQLHPVSSGCLPLETVR